MSLTTDQMEHQADSHRANISELIDELRNKVTPGEVIDQLFGWDEGHEVARNFGRQVTNNPLPLALIGTGVAWLMFSDGSQRRNGNANARTGSGAMENIKSGARSAAQGVSSAADYASSTADSIGSTMSGTGAKLSSAAGAALDSAKQTVSAVSSSAQSAYGQAKDSVAAATESVGAASDRVASTASAVWDKTTGLTQSATDTVRQTGTNLGRIAQEQPLLVAGLGFALGMALGSVLPTTEAENSLLGEQADAVKQKAGELAGEGYEKAKAVAQKSYEAASEAATQEAQNQGLTAEVAESAEHSPTRAKESSSTDEVYGSKNGGDQGAGAYERP
jgi:hypothetical protein